VAANRLLVNPVIVLDSYQERRTEPVQLSRS
jgi:hypothetical protein